VAGRLKLTTPESVAWVLNARIVRRFHYAPGITGAMDGQIARIGWGGLSGNATGSTETK